MENNKELDVTKVMITSVFQLFTMAAMACLLDILHRHRRAAEVIASAKAYEEISDQLTDEQKKELADSIYHRAEEITHYKAW